MRKLSWDEIKQIETEVYNEGYRGGTSSTRSQH